MSLLSALLRYFAPKPKWKPVPRQLITPYTMHDAEESERLIMKLGYARSPAEARRLLSVHNVSTAYELLPLLPPRRKISFWTRLIRLVRKWDRHNPVKHKRGNPYQIDIRYRFSKSKE